MSSDTIWGMAIKRLRHLDRYSSRKSPPMPRRHRPKTSTVVCSSPPFISVAYEIASRTARCCRTRCKMPSICETGWESPTGIRRMCSALLGSHSLRRTDAGISGRPISLIRNPGPITSDDASDSSAVVADRRLLLASSVSLLQSKGASTPLTLLLSTATQRSSTSERTSLSSSFAFPLVRSEVVGSELSTRDLKPGMRWSPSSCGCPVELSD
mmetsp:Transcript_7820/g.29357  ORF Transcript_7820/g.29357 Transcript_7820/m.29357 type:complete len:212 (+) Transcript_7820:882-1517(+)